MNLIRLMHATEDDLAPIDYSYVPSVSEGRRLEQMKKMHRPEASAGPIVRRRAEPEGASDLPEYRVHAVHSAPDPSARDTVMRRLPSMADGPAPAQRAAYPPGYHHEGKEDYGIPEDPFNPPAEMQQRRRRAQQPAPVQPSRRGEGERMAVPAEEAREMPEWLKVARQNNMPMERPDVAPFHYAPQQQAAPEVDALGRPMHRRQTAMTSPYEQAGYPETLVQAQRAMEAEQAAQPVRRRHGAQYAVNPHRAARLEHDAQKPQERLPWERTPAPQPAPVQPVYPHQLYQGGDTFSPDGSVYAPPVHIQYNTPEPVMRKKRPEPQDVPDDGWHVENDEREPIALPAWLTRVPWLGIGAFVSVLAAVILWIMGSGYEKEIRLVLAAREAQELSIVEKHPLKYESLIDEKANKYNLSPAFIAAIMLNESSFRPDATASSTGAKGLMQLVDVTSEWVHGKLDWPEPYNPQDMYIPEVNAEFGCWYLNYLSREFRGDPILVAAAYHAGQNNVQNWLNTSAYSPDGLTLSIDQIPFDDTRRYVTRVLNNYAAYKRLYYGG